MNKTIQKQYEKEWKNRVVRDKLEDFNHYERNWVLPPLFKKGQKVLDLASGNSIVGQYLINNYDCEVSAIDFSKAAVNDAKRRGVKAVVGSVEEELPFKNSTFDLVFWGDNIEHVFYPEKILNQIARVLKPGGRLILSTPNQAYWRYRAYTFSTGELPKTEGEDNSPWEWTHIRFFTRKIIKKLFSITGFKELSFHGVSRRRLDRPLLTVFPEIFGMIMVIEAEKI